jgi:ATP-dependent DNA ligase
LELPPDDWCLEPKINGVRVIVVAGEVYTRTGRVLSQAKGAIRLRHVVAGVPEVLDGEWVLSSGCFHLFDLPEAGGEYDERRHLIQDLVERVGRPTFLYVPSFENQFPQMYASLKAAQAEGVVLKRRKSLYTKQSREGVETRDWLKRRFIWD